ncbi:Innexin [Fasciola hepatica]|uniref:Innexin n=2 Tax=Digenea TaxID=6179 RepID=A0A4E0RS52_FASHE|nr:Innexin [Fasciola hepatica]
MNADYVWKLSKFGRLTSTRLRFDDDFADRLNYQLTGLLLFVFVGIIGIRQYVGKPIQCWTPQEFTRSWEEYAENYCWVASTYFVHLNGYPGPPPPHMFFQREINAGSAIANSPGTGGSPAGTFLFPTANRGPGSHQNIYPGMYQAKAGERPAPGRLISYYQWAPILLAIQSFLFYLPCLIWRLFASQSGFHLRRIMQLASEAALAAPTEADASTQPTSTEPSNPNRTRLSIQNLFSLVHSTGAPATTSFAPTKSVRTLARYLDMCLMRQRELRLAVLLGHLPLNETVTAVNENISRKASQTAPRTSNIMGDTQMGCTASPCDHSHSLFKLASFNLEGTDELYKSFYPPSNTSTGPLGKRDSIPLSYMEHDSLYKPKGMNCLDLICCCGLASWCTRKVCQFCCCCFRRHRRHRGGVGFGDHGGRGSRCCGLCKRVGGVGAVVGGGGEGRATNRSTSTLGLTNRCIGCPCNRHVSASGSLQRTSTDKVGKLRLGNSCQFKATGLSGAKLELDPIWGTTFMDEDHSCGGRNCPGCGCMQRQQQQQQQLYQRSSFTSSSGPCSCCGRYQGNFLVRLHTFVKLLYLVNTIGQIYLLEYYTGVEYNFYGIRVLYDLARGRQWEESGHFPRVTFCDFEARKLAQSHYYTLQCVLPINMFLEKIYIFLWLWFFVVGLVTLTSIVIWICRLGTKYRRYAWIRHQLITIRQLNKSPISCMQFVENHLGPDGVFVLRLIAQNYGDLVAGDTVGELWTAYWQRRMGERKMAENLTTPQPKVPEPLSTIPSGRPHTRTKRVRDPRPTAPPVEMLSSGDPLHRTPSQKELRRKQLLQTGYSATMMATEMIHPSDRFAVPLLTSSRKPPSVHSRESSRYSQESRDRDRSESPPPIPTRSPEGGDYSFSDHVSIRDEGMHSDNQSANGAITPTHVGEEHDESNVPMDRDAHDLDDHDDREVAGVFDHQVDLQGDYREQYVDYIQDENIV